MFKLQYHFCGTDFESMSAPASLPTGYRIYKQNKQLSMFFSLSSGGNFMTFFGILLAFYLIESQEVPPFTPMK